MDDPLVENGKRMLEALGNKAFKLSTGNDAPRLSTIDGAEAKAISEAALKSRGTNTSFDLELSRDEFIAIQTLAVRFPIMLLSNGMSYGTKYLENGAQVSGLQSIEIMANAKATHITVNTSRMFI